MNRFKEGNFEELIRVTAKLEQMNWSNIFTSIVASVRSFKKVNIFVLV